MPSTSKKQANFMRAVAHSPSFAKKVGVSQKVGKDFAMADKKKGKYAAGGSYPVRLNLDEIKKKSMKGENRPARPSTQADLDRHARMQGEESRSEGRIMRKAKGGSAMMKKMMADKAGRAMKKKSADTMGRAMKYAKGGGIETKGKTKGKMVKMAGGGMYGPGRRTATPIKGPAAPVQAPTVAPATSTPPQLLNGLTAVPFTGLRMRKGGKVKKGKC